MIIFTFAAFYLLISKIILYCDYSKSSKYNYTIINFEEEELTENNFNNQFSSIIFRFPTLIPSFLMCLIRI